MVSSLFLKAFRLPQPKWTSRALPSFAGEGPGQTRGFPPGAPPGRDSCKKLLLGLHHFLKGSPRWVFPPPPWGPTPLAHSWQGRCRLKLAAFVGFAPKSPQGGTGAFSQGEPRKPLPSPFQRVTHSAKRTPRLRPPKALRFKFLPRGLSADRRPMLPQYTPGFPLPRSSEPHG